MLYHTRKNALYSSGMYSLLWNLGIHYVSSYRPVFDKAFAACNFCSSFLCSSHSSASAYLCHVVSSVSIVVLVFFYAHLTLCNAQNHVLLGIGQYISFYAYVVCGSFQVNIRCHAVSNGSTL